MPVDLTITSGALDVPQTVAALTAELSRRGIDLFAVIDHGAGAASAGLELDAEVVVIFGSAAVGTRLMQADPRAGIDLPLRMLIWSENGATSIGFENPHALAARFNVLAAAPVLDGMAALLAALADVISRGVASP